jgi:hypothetical protein
MAVNARAILGRGVRFPFRPGLNGGFALIAGEENLDQAIILLLSTALGERQMRFDFGSDLPRAIFEPINAATLVGIQESARIALRDWEPRIIVRHVSALPDPVVESKVTLSITFDIPQTNSRRNLVFPFYLQGG